MGISYGEVRDIHPHQTVLMPSSTILVVGTPIFMQAAILYGAALCLP